MSQNTAVDQRIDSPLEKLRMFPVRVNRDTLELQLYSQGSHAVYKVQQVMHVNACKATLRSERQDFKCRKSNSFGRET